MKNQKKEYKKTLKKFFTKKVRKVMIYHIENNYGFDEELTDEGIESNTLSLFRDVYVDID